MVSLQVQNGAQCDMANWSDENPDAKVVVEEVQEEMVAHVKAC